MIVSLPLDIIAKINIYGAILSNHLISDYFPKCRHVTIGKNIKLDFLNLIAIDSILVIDAYGRCGTQNLAVPCDFTLDQLRLSRCEQIANVSPFRNVRNQCISGSQKLTDISPLCNVYCLNLSNNSQIYDVSTLGKVRYLDLSYTANSDISPLSNVYHLTINDCKNIRNISPLNQVSILSVTDTTIRGLSSYHSVKRLFLDLSQEAISYCKNFRKKTDQIVEKAINAQLGTGKSSLKST
jgi:hypothetical protein